MIFSCFPLTAYDLAMAPFARTNCLNQIMVCIPIAVVKLLQSMCRKIAGLLPFPRGEDVEQLFGQGAPATQLRETHRDPCRGGRCQCHFCNSVSTLPWHLSVKEVQAGGIAPFGYQNIPPVCSYGTNISTVNTILWDLPLDYRHDWPRFFL